MLSVFTFLLSDSKVNIKIGVRFDALHNCANVVSIVKQFWDGSNRNGSGANANPKINSGSGLERFQMDP